MIKDFDDRLHHYGPERLLAELRRKVWILRGREAVQKHQRKCIECQKLRASPKLPKMADLPIARLRLHKPAFYSTGVDCFGPMRIKLGRRQYKRWGVIFKCMTTRAVHLDLLKSMDSDAFLLAVRRFIAHHGKPYELLSDCGTNFKGGESELHDAFTAMNPEINSQLSSQRIRFRYNPPYAPHFGGLWEREIRSVKQGLYAILGEQTVTESVLRTVLAEIASILNSKPLGYVSSDIADVDPVTPNPLLLGRCDASLPQVVYPEDELLGKRRWRHSQILADQFSKTFIRRYLPSLQSRGKWQKDRDNVKEGDVVMIVDPQQIRAKWLVGRVTDAFSGSDRRVRSASVRVGEQDYQRPVSRLVKLPDLDNE
ncbi:uncharacterized protein LOC124285741 [Haliotis rubra]|uniref:uncharacterized protein LOC124285741 n=1 Tax=Haliotis rubra TaxID=36100 RepID=UPI001EE5B246|nr:uncharacterized protein LOC124285741 [Haliotis rubra]